MNHHQIDYAIVATKLSAILGRRWSVSIVFGGDPSTNGRTITLPHWNLKDAKLRTALYGLIAHEAGGHIRQTNFQLLAQKLSSMDRHPFKKEWKSIANILEDVRIEANLLRTYPGAAAYLNTAVDVMLCDPERTMPASEIGSYWELVLNWSLLTFRFEMLGQNGLREQAQDYQTVLEQVLPANVITEARAIARKVASLGPNRTEYVLVQEYSDQLLKLLSDAMPSKQPQDQSQAAGQGGPDEHNGDMSDHSGGHGTQDDQAVEEQSGQGNQNGGHGTQDGQTGEQSGQGSQKGDHGAQDGQTGEQSDQGSQNGGHGAQDGRTGEQNGQGSQNGGHGAQDGRTGEQNGQGRTQRKRNLSEAGISQEIGDIFRHLVEKGRSKDPEVLKVPCVGYSDPGGFEVQPKACIVTRAQKARSMIQGLTSALSPMLCGDMEYSANRTSGPRINSRRIARVLCEPEPAIFRKLTIDDDQAVAVQILVDRSSSTAGTVLECETISAIGIATALEQFSEVETAISYFPADRQGEARIAAPFIKRFGIPVSRCMDCWPIAKGGTPLADAYHAAAFNFFHSEKERKILLVLTDGKPTDAGSAAKQKAFLNRLGIEVYGVIVSDKVYPDDLFDDSVQICDPKALPRSLSALVRRII